MDLYPLGVYGRGERGGRPARTTPHNNSLNPNFAKARRRDPTEGMSECDDAVAAIRARHAQVHTDRAVRDRQMSQQEADG